MLAFRSRAFDILIGLWTGLFGLFIPFLLTAGPKRLRAVSRLWASGVLWLLRYVVGLDYREIGLENRPKEACLIVCNHQSTWETIALLSLFPDVAVVAKEELLNIPIFGWYLRKSPMITIDRESGTQAFRRMVEGAKTALSEGRSVLLFPEGTRRPPDTPIAFKRGVEMLCDRLDVAILPVVVDSGRFWGIENKPRRAGMITVSSLPALHSGPKGSELMRAAMDAMEAERLRMAAVAAG
ncbi:MAG: lysophospholipid acyltransferase family protein [Alphaproteobacteria bacterium]